MKALLVLCFAIFVAASDLFYDSSKGYYVGNVRKITDKGLVAVSKAEYFNLTKTGKLEVVHNTKHFNVLAAQTYTWSGAGDWTWDAQYVTSQQTCRSATCTYPQTTEVTINQSFNISMDTSTFIPYVNSLNIYALTWVTTASRSNLQLTLSNCQSGVLVFQPKGKFIRGTANGAYYMAETPLVATDGQLYGLVWNAIFSTTCASCNTTAPSGTKQGSAGDCCVSDSDCQGTCNNGVCSLCPNCCVDDDDCDYQCWYGVCQPEPTSYTIAPLLPAVCSLSTATTTATTAATTATSTGGGNNGGDITPPSIEIPCVFCWLGTGLGLGPTGAVCQNDADCSGKCNNSYCQGGGPPSCYTCFAGLAGNNGTNNAICYNNNDCLSDVCNNNLCVSNTTISIITTIVSGVTKQVTKTIPVTIETIVTTISGNATTYTINNIPAITPMMPLTYNTTISGTPTQVITRIPYTTPNLNATSTTASFYTVANTQLTQSIKTTTTKTTSTATTTPIPTCTSGYCGKNNGQGATGACCATSNDCIDTCNSNGKCGISDGTTAPGTCTSTGGSGCTSGYCGKNNGQGATGACCATSNDCIDTCNSNGKCGVSDGTTAPGTC